MKLNELVVSRVESPLKSSRILMDLNVALTNTASVLCNLFPEITITVCAINNFTLSLLIYRQPTPNMYIPQFLIHMKLAMTSGVPEQSMESFIT